MKTIYYPEDDILVIHFSDKPVSREVSQNWNVNISYAEDGEITEIVVLEAKPKGWFPWPPSSTRHEVLWSSKHKLQRGTHKTI